MLSDVYMLYAFFSTVLSIEGRRPKNVYNCNEMIYYRQFFVTLSLSLQHIYGLCKFNCYTVVILQTSHFGVHNWKGNTFIANLTSSYNNRVGFSFHFRIYQQYY